MGGHRGIADNQMGARTENRPEAESTDDTMRSKAATVRV